ncbi:hypothetical protein H4R34_000705 [Dimargaris verticillata]|uniref:Inosine triphosphate pyrophosphatase-like protein n=1 Tax=Dimargaris verticillata TaxID=2761393 RepID=A0A9W8BC60_9FUNG|nr:hypothetical protein H4R34_000705 [Dimargaris verticillata]
MASLSVDFLKTLQARFRIILGSTSPRRKQILNNLGIPYETIPSKFSENLDWRTFSHPHAYVLENAKQKAIDVYAQVTASNPCQPCLVIGADTVVYANETVLEKPKTAAEALKALQLYRGQPHAVLTAICLVWASAPADTEPLDTDSSVALVLSGADKATETLSLVNMPGLQEPVWLYSAIEETQVLFAPDVPLEALQAYVQTGEPMDKAGSYGYQGLASFFISKIDGDYYNVVGFPCHRFFMMLYRLVRLECSNLKASLNPMLDSPDELTR